MYPLLHVSVFELVTSSLRLTILGSVGEVEQRGNLDNVGETGLYSECRPTRAKPLKGPELGQGNLK